MNALLVIMLTLVAIGGTIVVFTSRPQRQAVSLAVYGVLMSVTILVLQAPDEALTQDAVGSAVVPKMVLLTVRTVRKKRRS